MRSVKILIVLSFILGFVMPQLNLMYCQGSYNTCTSSPACNDVFTSINFNYCVNTGANCQSISSYSSIMSEFTCLSQCSNDSNDPDNENYEEFQDCIQDLVNEDQCGETYTNCQQESGCAAVVNVASIQQCYNSNSYCTSLSGNSQDNSYLQLYNCYVACLQNASSTNQNWYSLTFCVSTLGICESQINACYSEFQTCGAGLVAASICGQENCQISSLPASGSTYSSCFLPCLNKQSVYLNNQNFQSVISCVQNLSPGPLPSPTPAPAPSPSPAPSPNPTPSPSSASSATSNTTSASSASSTNSTSSSFSQIFYISSMIILCLLLI